MSDTPLSGLTRRQVEFMQVLQELVDKTGATPSYDTLANELELKSKSTVARFIDVLEGRGYLRRNGRGRCSLSIVRRVAMPDFGEAATQATDLRWLAEVGLKSLEAEWLKIANAYGGGSEAAWERTKAHPAYLDLVGKIDRARAALGRPPFGAGEAA